ncbi:4-aminobutyrate transaminase [Penicillium freii]|nr:4-aminobutyrate transaminase [Penicillium freii]
MAADSPQLKCPLENHSQVNAAEEQCYLIDIKRLIKEFHNPFATVIAEPIEPKGGDNHASPVFIYGLRTNVLIVDEVQTGVGATGKFLATIIRIYPLLAEDAYMRFSLNYLKSTPSTFRSSVVKSFDVNIGSSSHRKLQHMHQGL